MALPQQVIDRLSKETPGTPGWSYGLILFGGGVFAITLLVYFGLTLGYEPYLNNQVSQLKTQITTQSNAISTSDQTKLVTFYSEISNVQTALANHVLFSHFVSWLEQNTEANVSYSRMSFASGDQITLEGTAPNETDVNQQAAIFQASPAVTNFSITSVTFTESTNLWQFSVMLTVDPNQLLRAEIAGTAPATSTTQ